MEEQILRFNDQFAIESEILNSERLPLEPTHIIVCGMGGSHLGARLLMRHDPTLPISIHSDYGLPRETAERLSSALIVASSYSGETEETIDAARSAVDAGLSVAVVTTGGTLEEFACAHSLPLILIPKTSAEPRMAVGAFMLALARLMQKPELEALVRSAGESIKTSSGKDDGAALAAKIVGSIPVVYSSDANSSLAYFWKIAFNETGKSPSFYNVLPEVCHNELSGFDNSQASEGLSTSLHVLFLTDEDDHPRITKRMHILRELLTTKHIASTTVALSGESSLEKAFLGILKGVWTSVALARLYKSEDAKTPLIAEFKKRMLEP